MSITTILTIITILAILLGPIVAIQAHKWRELYTEERSRKLNIFKTLMATRGSRLSFEHVRALNMIDTEFYDEREIINAWKCYLDCLNGGDAELANWADRRDSLFIDLLSKMAKSLRYHFDCAHLKKAVYTATAHGKEEEYQYFVRESIRKIFSGEQAISMKVISSPMPNEASKKQDKIRT